MTASLFVGEGGNICDITIRDWCIIYISALYIKTHQNYTFQSTQNTTINATASYNIVSFKPINSLTTVQCIFFIGTSTWTMFVPSLSYVRHVL